MRPNITLGESRKKSPLGRLLGVSLLGGLIAGGVYWYQHRAEEKQQTQVAQAQAAAAQAALPPPAPVLPPSRDQLRAQAGMKLAAMEINGPLETAFVSAVGAVGPALAQVVNRTLVWWVEVPNEILRGDKLEVLFEERNNEEPLVHAVRFASNKTGQTHLAYRFQPEGSPYARYYLADGNELELRLESSPVDDYEQITSLIRDGRKHKGVDFKTPVGTPVRAPFDAVITRKNWNFRSNGNCLELDEVGGSRKALMLHLDVLPSDLRVGQRISRGQVVAKSGNSGRSFAPHLHYQLMRGEDRVLDPFESHRSFRKQLASGHLPSLNQQIARLDALLAP